MEFYLLAMVCVPLLMGALSVLGACLDSGAASRMEDAEREDEQAAVREAERIVRGVRL